METSIENLAKVTIQTKIKELPNSNLVEVAKVVDILLDLQQELLVISASSPEPVSV